jgi:hypothetical protein
MSASNSKIRRDGWTAERQLRFLDALRRTRSVTRAARAAGMSRESAYRLRRRKDGALFAAAWDRALEGPALSVSKGHKLGSLSPRRRLSTRQISRGNPSKVTKSMKCKDPRIDWWDQSTEGVLSRLNAFEKLLRDFREMPV